MSVSHFIKYNNTIPIALSVALLAAGTVAAANPDVREGVAKSVYDTEETVISIDNTYIVDKNLNSYTPEIKIVEVTEDSENYYVTYEFTTIELDDFVWQDIEVDKEMTVAKAQLGDRDLGLYVTEQLKEIIARELTRLRETQEIEERQVSRKRVATKYKGLVGRFLDETTETLPGYKPVVPQPKQASIEPAKVVAVPVVETLPEEVAGTATSTATTTEETSDTQEENESEDQIPPTIQVLGENPVEVEIRDAYIDLGAVVTDNIQGELSYEIYLDGVLVDTVVINTASTSSYVVTYISMDSAGNQASAERLVEVIDPDEESSGGSGGGGGGTDPDPSEETSTSTATTTEETSEPEEEEETGATSTPPIVEEEEETASTTDENEEETTEPEEETVEENEEVAEEIPPEEEPEVEETASST